jgi:hypothetical protein
MIYKYNLSQTCDNRLLDCYPNCKLLPSIIFTFFFFVYFIMIFLSIYIYNWIGNKFLQLTSPSPYKYINSINKTNQMTANVQAISIIISKLSKNMSIIKFTTMRWVICSESCIWCLLCNKKTLISQGLYPTTEKLGHNSIPLWSLRSVYVGRSYIKLSTGLAIVSFNNSMKRISHNVTAHSVEWPLRKCLTFQSTIMHYWFQVILTTLQNFPLKPSI